MRHRDVVKWLPEYAAGVLPAAVSPDFEFHVRDCGVCRQWLDTHRLLGEILCSPADSPAPEKHPGAEELALCVTRPEEVEELDVEF